MVEAVGLGDQLSHPLVAEAQGLLDKAETPLAAPEVLRA
jgi:hypothetical protein